MTVTDIKPEIKLTKTLVQQIKKANADDPSLVGSCDAWIKHTAAGTRMSGRTKGAVRSAAKAFKAGGAA